MRATRTVPLRTEKRVERRRKVRFAPRGGTRAGQLALLRTRKGYAGSAKRFVRMQDRAR